MGQRFSERGHARKMKRHVTERGGRWPAFVERNGHVVVSDRDPPFEFKFFLQTESALEPFRASFWTAHRESEMTDDPHREWNFAAHVIEEIAAGVERQIARLMSRGETMPMPRNKISPSGSRQSSSRSATRRSPIRWCIGERWRAIRAAEGPYPDRRDAEEALSSAKSRGRRRPARNRRSRE